MTISKIEDVLEDLKNGKMIILVDDEDRENEGDLTMAAEKVTPETINFIRPQGTLGCQKHLFTGLTIPYTRVY